MLGKTHFVTGVTAGGLAVTAGSLAGVWVGFLPSVDVLAKVGFIAVTAYATLLPDWDHYSSTVTRALGFPGWFICWTIRGWPIDWDVRILWIWPWSVHVNLLPWDVDHRGLTHDPRIGPASFAVALGVPTLLLPGWFGDQWWLWTLAIFLGCLTHIWGDGRTLSGVPLGDRRIWSWGAPFETGSEDERARFEWYYRPASALACVLAFIATIYPIFT
jgi:hypothetical protein